MANALFVDAFIGYEYFLKNRGEVSIEQVNRFLEQKTRNPIALRTYTHYKKLLANGFRSYIPINKFDVFQAIGKLQIAADRRRFLREITNISARLSKNGEKWVDVTLVDRSLVGFGANTKDKFPVSKGTTGWIRIKGYKVIPVIFIWRKHESNSTRIGLRSTEFIAKYRILGDELSFPKPMGTLKIMREIDDELYWENIYGAFEKVDELLKAVTDLIYTFEEVFETEISVAPTILESIEFGSPGELQTKIDLGIAEILRVVLEKIQLWGLEKRKMRAEVENMELSNVNLKIETVRNAIKLRVEASDIKLPEDIADGLKNLIPKLFDVNNPKVDLFTPQSPELAILRERILPAATNIVAGDDTDFKIDVSTDETVGKVGKKKK